MRADRRALVDIPKTNPKTDKTMVKYSFSQGGTVLTIYDSCAVPKSYFQKKLNQIKALHGEQPIFYRSDYSLKMEWAVHNFCHQVGFYKERTKDCDFDIPCNLPEWVYEAVGVLVWVFVK